ncbi:MAG TPA: SRPBCC family protein [Solirubrobacteraceae bacterium]|nr:SRPBCC family protein [Solirubrobacteraceae bacterium]
MSRVVASATLQIPAAPEKILDVLRDYREGREPILTSNYTAYRVEQGGKGEGTVYAYHFAAGRRERDYRLHVYESPGGLQESDQLSSFVTTWHVDPSPSGSEVTVESSWDGAGGIAGIFEGFFAPKGMRRIYGQMLANLAEAVEA